MSLLVSRARKKWVQSGIVKLNFNASPTDGNGNVAPAAETPQTPDAKPNPPSAAAPPAAAAVATGKTQRELDLEVELAAERERVSIESEARKQRERDLCELQDKHENYRKKVERDAKPAAKKSSAWTLIQ